MWLAVGNTCMNYDSRLSMNLKRLVFEPFITARIIITAVLLALLAVPSGCASKKGVKTSIDLSKQNEKHFAYPITEGQARAIAYGALAAEAGSGVQKASGYAIGYTGRLFGGLEWADLLVTAVPIRFVDASGNPSAAFAFEVGFTGSSIIVGPRRSSKVLRRMMNEAALIAKPIELTPAQIVEGRVSSLGSSSESRTFRGATTLPDTPRTSGTGFLITEDGYLITNEHVVKEAAQVRLVTSAGIIAAKVVKVDAANDLALLKAEGRFAALPVVASRAVRLGSTVATVGFPNVGLQGFAPKLARGEIAALSGVQDDARYFQISVPVQPGNSGGALVDERGNVVGVVSAKLSARAALAASGALPENVNYAVKSSFLLSFLESVPEVSAKLKEANTNERKFEDVVKSAEQAAVLVLVY